jgi:hypothetical protein
VLQSLDPKIPINRQWRSRQVEIFQAKSEVLKNSVAYRKATPFQREKLELRQWREQMERLTAMQFDEGLLRC